MPSAGAGVTSPRRRRSRAAGGGWIALGAKLVRTGVVARRIAIVATTCSTCGSVKVYWGSKLLRTISLRSASTVNRRLITVTTSNSARKATLTIKVSTSSRKVVIDGVAIRRKLRAEGSAARAGMDDTTGSRRSRLAVGRPRQGTSMSDRGTLEIGDRRR